MSVRVDSFKITAASYQFVKCEVFRGYGMLSYYQAITEPDLVIQQHLLEILNELETDFR